MNRRELLNSSAFAGLGVVLGGSLTASAATAAQTDTKQKGSRKSTILNSKRTLGSGKAAMKVSALSLGCMGMQGGRG